MILALLATAQAWDLMPGLSRSRTRLRRLECEHVTALEGSRQYPGRIAPPDVRTRDPEEPWVVCRDRIFEPGVRRPEEEAFLDRLGLLGDGVAAQVASAGLDRTLLVEVFHPSPEIADKLEFAVKNALVAQGLAVSDRTPALAAGDVAVLTRMPPFEAFPAACARGVASGGLREGDALVGVVQVDPRETRVHAALCVDGGWTWLR